MWRSRPSANIVVANMQWWEKRRKNFHLFLSELTIEEIAQGDSEAVEKRLQFIDEIPILQLNKEIMDLGNEIIVQHALPPKAGDDAIHIAYAAVYNIDFLLTWNCRHIANEVKKASIARLIESKQYKSPFLLTPQAFMEIENERQ